jgi:hypothetical protein
MVTITEAISTFAEVHIDLSEYTATHSCRTWDPVHSLTSWFVRRAMSRARYGFSGRV